MLENSLKNFRFVNYLLAVLILVAVLLLIRNIVNISFSIKESPFIVSEDKSLNNMKKKDIMQYSLILEKNPFGPPMKLRPIAVTQRTENLYGSLSDLILLGTVVGPENLSYAIFEDKSGIPPGNQEIFAYRENVLNHGILTKIDRSSVKIEQDAVMYTLTIPFEEMGTKTEKPQALRRDSSQKSFAKKIGEKQYILDSRRVQQSLANPEQILTDARLLPNIINGKQEGFKISEVVPDGIYHGLGLKNGDTLLRVNGLEISNPEVAIQAMSALRGMNRVGLDIIRNGKNMSMNYQIK
jgi:general secretion pathway protein C